MKGVALRWPKGGKCLVTGLLAARVTGQGLPNTRGAHGSGRFGWFGQKENLTHDVHLSIFNTTCVKTKKYITTIRYIIQRYTSLVLFEFCEHKHN